MDQDQYYDLISRQLDIAKADLSEDDFEELWHDLEEYWQHSLKDYP